MDSQVLVNPQWEGQEGSQPDRPTDRVGRAEEGGCSPGAFYTF